MVSEWPGEGSEAWRQSIPPMTIGRRRACSDKKIVLPGDKKEIACSASLHVSLYLVTCGL